MISFHSQLDVILSVLECMNSDAGIRLVRKAVLTERVIVVGEFW